MQFLGLQDLPAYRTWLEAHPEEWDELDTLCRITISRFYRDCSVFDTIRDIILPDLAYNLDLSNGTILRCWSAGCASGEEPYTLSIIWREVLTHSYPGIDLEIIATDIDACLLDRAAKGYYPRSAMKELPESLQKAAFVPTSEENDDHVQIGASFRAGIKWCRQDIRKVMPQGPFDLILCRNLVFTYFDDFSQGLVLPRIHERLTPNGVLVIGKHESLPEQVYGYQPTDIHLGIYRKYV